MNKYITALFVVLAATGVEAQTYKSALKAALENCSLEEIYHHVEQCGIETELLPIIEAFKNIQKEKMLLLRLNLCHVAKYKLTKESVPENILKHV